MQTRIPLRGWACALALAIPAACASAADPAPLTLEQAIARAYAANPSLRAVSHGVAIADAERTQAGALPNPELSYLREGSDTRTVQVSQALELGGKRGARIGVADRQRQLAVDALAVQRAALRADVIAAYLEALLAAQRMELAQAELDLAAQATSAAARRVAAGKISPIEQTRSGVAEAAARLELGHATAALALARRRLSALCADPDPGVRPAGSDPVLGSGQLVAPALVNEPIQPLHELLARLEDGPAMRHARGTVAHAEAQATLERAKRVPDLTLTLGSKREAADPSRTQTVAGIAIPLPLFDRNSGNVLASLRRVDQARDELEAERLRLREAVADAWQRADVAQSQLAAIGQSVLPPAREAYAAAVKGFELGKFSFLDVLDSQRTLFQARAQYLSALSERYRAIANLQRHIEGSVQ
jgi:cobalt-zinc-cadmium efflux system outer membrane protein